MQGRSQKILKLALCARKIYCLRPLPVGHSYYNYSSKDKSMIAGSIAKIKTSQVA